MLFIDDDALDWSINFLDDHDQRPCLPIIADSESNCPDCSRLLSSLGRYSYCPTCQAVFDRVHIQEGEPTLGDRPCVCGYSFRGISSTNCPECGRNAFDITEFVIESDGVEESESLKSALRVLAFIALVAFFALIIVFVVMGFVEGIV